MRGHLAHQLVLEEALGLNVAKARAEVALGTISGPILRVLR